MTTIGYKNGIMAGDGRVTLGDMVIKEDIQKVFWVNNHLCGICGRARAINTFVEWLQKHTDYSIVNQQVGDLVDLIPPQLEDDDGYSALVVTPDKQVLLYEGNTPIMMGTDVPMSIGSGSCFALAAMKAGSSAEEAVKVAMSLDVYSGGTISTVALEEEPEELTREAAEQMDKETLLKVLFGEEEEPEETTEEEEPCLCPDCCAEREEDSQPEYHEIIHNECTIRYTPKTEGVEFSFMEDTLQFEFPDDVKVEDLVDWEIESLAKALYIKGNVRHNTTKQLIVDNINLMISDFVYSVKDEINNRKQHD